MEHTIYTYGGGEILTYIFNGIAAVMNSGSMNTILLLNGTIGITWVAIFSYLNRSFSMGAKWGLWFLVVTNLIIYPKGSVIIEDLVTDRIRNYPLGKKIDNVPLILGGFVGSISSIGKSLNEIVEGVFTLPDVASYQKTGMVFASRLIAEMPRFTISDVTFKTNMENFVNQCIVYDAMIGYKYTQEDLQKTNDIWGLVIPKASRFMGFYYKDPQKGRIPKFMTCREGADALEKEWKEQIEKTTIRHGRAFFGTKEARMATAATLKMLNESFRTLTGFSESSENLLMQQMMIDSVYSAPQNKLKRLGARSYASTKSQLQQRNAGFISGDNAGKLLPIMRTVLEALCYGCSIFVFFLIALPFGHRILMSYAGILMWIQLWPPLYAILNFIMTVAARNNSTGLVGKDGLNMLNSYGLSSVNADIASMAGWLSMSVPFISYAILKGGAASFMHLATHLGGAAQSANASAANEMTTGNYSLANVSQRSVQMKNFNAFKHNSNSDHLSGESRSNLSDGGMAKITRSGNLVTQSGAGYNLSQGRTQVRMGENISQALTNANSNQQEILAAKGKDYVKAQQRTLRSGADFLDRHTKGVGDGERYDYGGSTHSGKTMDNTMRFVRNLQDKFNVDSSTANKMAIAASAGYKVGFKFLKTQFEAGSTADTSFTSQSGKSISLGDVKDFAKESGFKESLDTISKAAQNTHYNEHQSEEASLANGFSASVGETSELRDSISTHERYSANLTFAIQATRGKSLDLSTDMYQDVLEYIAEQPNTHGRNGMNMARAIMESAAGSPTFDRKMDYIKDYTEEHTGSFLEAVKNNGVKSFEEVQHLASTSFSGVSIERDAAQHKAQVLEKSNAAGLGEDFNINTAPKETYENRQKEASTALNNQQTSLLKDKSTITGKVAEGMDSNGLWTASKNFVGPVNNALASNPLRPWSKFGLGGEAENRVSELKAEEEES